MTPSTQDRITDEAGRIEELARQVAALRRAAKKKKGARGAARAQGKIAARLETVRLTMTAALDDLAALQEG